MRDEKPTGVRSVEQYSSSRAICTIIGVVHNKVSPPEFRDFLAEYYKPSVVCVESPVGSSTSTEDKGARLYCSRDGAKLVAIDRKYHTISDEVDEYVEQVYGELEDSDIPNWDSEIKDHIRGKTEANLPELAEADSIRETYMAREILGVVDKGYRNVVAIVGAAHVFGIKESMGILENKYGY